MDPAQNARVKSDNFVPSNLSWFCKDPFQAVVSQVTDKFKTLSRLILELQARAESEECRDKTLSNLIRKVQVLEEKKLHLTVDLQLALQQSEDNPDDELMRTNCRGIQTRLKLK